MVPLQQKGALQKVLTMASLKPASVALWISIALLCILLLPSSIYRLKPPGPGECPVGSHLRHSLLIVGDSLSVAVGEQLERYFARYSNCVVFHRLGKVSSGLARPEFFDWEQNLKDLVGRQQPDIVAIMLGANDNKPLKKENLTIEFGASPWCREYAARLQRLYEICLDGNPKVRVFWIGVPIMGDPALTRDMKTINKTIESWCRDKPDCEYVNTWSALADSDGQYTQYHRDEQTGESLAIRAKDGVHLSAYGAWILAGVTIDSITKYCAFE